ncbi:thioredoxin family protein [Parageobacillus thermoglucosidasius]|uniref:Thioredoxin family protein n=1 Tax=Parageobacillus thermoglucosidasius TaxID=1426 RepID=A0AB38R2D7_PARTM|nr:thioredoxin family protein [Parageobacillus thermoglucosidasius]UOE76887.1 thioredoxin family protein [Parageobacillus thermoglucosidasius]
MKKLLIFGSIIVALFAALAFVTSYQQKEAVKDNPYHKKELDPATIEQLDDPNYQNLILPDELEKKLKNKETVTVYFYSPICPHCQKTTPIVVPLAKKMGIDLKLFNLLEFKDGWDKYHIEGTPTLVHYENGKEVKRISGYREEAVFRNWFSSIQQRNS